ncbi:hypothetical protein EN873_17530 [bacterium M00.F.Ca.ET.230.01.1.1]|nr:hypothetical protein EN873_17530 [bacterium M00.F.Ca.ET.230.01.1.1]
MRFELFFLGRIPSGNKGGPHWNFAADFRAQMHHQLVRLWKTNPLSEHTKWLSKPYNDNTWEGVATFERHGLDFVVVASQRVSLSIKMDVHFYEPAGELSVASDVADVDNRVKVLFDLLRLPDNPKHVPQGLVPHYCLMEDDRLVWELTVKRHRLLRTVETAEYMTRLDISVLPSRGAMGNLSIVDTSVY